MLTERLARLMLADTPIPRDVLHASRVALIDTLGCALAGIPEQAAQIACGHAAELGRTGRATIWGAAQSANPCDAALVNGIAAHALDFDDTMPNLRGHPSAPVLAAAFAMAELVGASGARLLDAYALGLEMAGKLGRVFGSAHYMRGWHATSTVGTFTATAAAARIAGLDAGQLACAWGLAAAQAGGLVSNFGTMAKPFQAGHAAQAAVQAVMLARAGFTANTAVFDGERAFPAQYHAGGDTLEAALADWGSPWELLGAGNNYKRWPCCYCNHRPLGGLLTLLEEHGIAREEVTAVRVGFPPGTDEPLIHRDPRTGLAAKFSIEYSVGAMLLDGRLGLDSFTDEMVLRPAARAAMQRVTRYRVPDEKVYSGTIGYNIVEVDTARGTFSRREERTPGSTGWPMAPAEQTEKFLDCAGRSLEAERARALHAALERIETIERVGELSDLLRDTRQARAA